MLPPECPSPTDPMPMLPGDCSGSDSTGRVLCASLVYTMGFPLDCIIVACVTPMTAATVPCLLVPTDA